MNKQKQFSFILIMLLLSSCFTPMGFAATEDSSGGTVGVGNATPTITNVDFELADTTDKDGAMIDVLADHHIEFTVGDTNTLDDLSTVVVVVWSTEESTEGGADGSDHYTYTWTEATSAWAETGPGDSMQTGSNSDPSDHTAATGNYVLAFQLQAIADFSDAVTDWSVKITATDDDAAADTDSTMNFGVNFYSSVNVDDSTHSWSSLVPGSSNNVLSGDGDIDVTCTANAPFDLRVKGSGAPASGGHTIALSNIEVHATTEGSAIDLTTSYADIVGLTSQARGASVAKAFKLWISVPTPQHDGSYTYTLWVDILAS